MRARRLVRPLLVGVLAALLATTPATGESPAVAPRATSSCSPQPALVDPDATPQARCLAERLDGWRQGRRMGVGQQLNVSSKHYRRPLTALGGRPVAVVGFDLEELDKAAGYEHPFDARVVADLLDLADGGAVLVATWHARNPHTRAPDSYGDRSWHDLGALLRDTPEAAYFWSDYDRKLELLRRLQEGDRPAAVVFRPLHEANGDWFWWGDPDRATYRRLWARMQARAAQAGVHNIVWTYSANARTSRHVGRPVRLLPAAVDVAGLDSYDPEARAPRDRLSLAGWDGLARKVRRMALTEVGPYDSTDGAWRPRVVTRTVRRQHARPLWALFWFDDVDHPRYRREIASLRGGLRWLASCPGARCRV